MAAQVIAGGQFTFGILFLDEDNNPLAVNDARITIFTLSAGVKNVLVDDAAMAGAVPAEVGRYFYAYSLPDVLAAGTVLYGELSGIDPDTGLRFVEEQIVNVVSFSGAGGGSCGGLRATFVKGG